MKNLLVPKHFTLEELTKTNTGLDNTPAGFVHIQNLILLGHVLDYIRADLSAPLYVNSAYRSEEVNKVVGGAERSYHRVGLAADIRCAQMDQLQNVLDHMKDNGWFTELINHGSYFHIAINPVEAFILIKDKLEYHFYFNN